MDAHLGDIQDAIRTLFSSINKLMAKSEEQLRGHQVWVLSTTLFKQYFTSTLVVALHLRPLRSTDRAGVEPHVTRAARRYMGGRKHRTSVDFI